MEDTRSYYLFFLLTKFWSSSDFCFILLRDPNLFFKNLLALLSNLVFLTSYIAIALFSYGANPATDLMVLAIRLTLSEFLLPVFLGLLLALTVVTNPLFNPTAYPSIEVLATAVFPIFVSKIFQLSLLFFESLTLYSVSKN